MLFSFLFCLLFVAESPSWADQPCPFQGTPEQAYQFLNGDPDNDPCPLSETPTEKEQCRRNLIDDIASHRAFIHIYKNQSGKYSLSVSRPTSLGGAQEVPMQGPCPTTDEIINSQSPEAAGEIGFSTPEGPMEQPAKTLPEQPLAPPNNGLPPLRRASGDAGPPQAGPQQPPIPRDINSAFDGSARRGQADPVQITQASQTTPPQNTQLGTTEPARYNLRYQPDFKPQDTGLGAMLEGDFDPNQKVARLIRDVPRERGLPDAASRLQYAEECIRSAAAVMFALADRNVKFGINPDERRVDLFDYASGCVNWIFDQHR